MFKSYKIKKNNVKEAVAGVDVQLNKRYDLIPNMLKVASKFMEHEKEIFLAVTQYRENALKAQTMVEKFDAEKFANTSLAHIGTNCFTAAFDVSSGGIPLIRLPSTIRQIDTRAFRNINQDSLPAGNFLIEEVSFGSPTKPSNFNFDSGVVNASEIFEQNKLISNLFKIY